MQFADLLLGVLAEFPESPDGCHSDRLRGAKRRIRPIRNHTAERSAEGVKGGDGDTGGFKASPAPLTGDCVSGACVHTTAEIATTDPPLLRNRMLPRTTVKCICYFLNLFLSF